MKVRSALFLFLLACLASCPRAALAVKSHGFGGGGGGDLYTVDFYIVDPARVPVWVSISPQQGAPSQELSAGTGFVSVENLPFNGTPLTYTFTFSTGPSSTQLTAFETDQVTFTSDGDMNDHNIYFYWPYPVVAGGGASSAPYDWHMATGENYSFLAQLNNAGIAVGYEQESSDTTDDLAITYAAGVNDIQTNISSSLGGLQSRATCIDNHGDIGAEEHDSAYPGERGVLLPAGGVATAIDSSNPFYPMGINGQDTVAGLGGGNADDACILINGAFTDLMAAGVLPGATLNSGATGVNDDDVVCGQYYDVETDQEYAFTWSPGDPVVTTLSPPGSLANASAAAINRQGIVVGSATDGSRTHALLWNTDGIVTDLGTLGGGSDVPSGINDLGQVVGNEGSTPWLWDPDFGMRSLASISPVHPPTVSGINDLGEIMGNGFHIGDEINGSVYAGMILTSSILSDPNFSAVNVGAGGYSYDPAGSPWTFTGYSGIAADGGTFNDEGWPVAPSGSQFAFLQSISGRGGQISQTIAIPSNGGYAVTFFAMQRDQAGRDNTGSASFQVAVDGRWLGDFTPSVGSWDAAHPRTNFTQAYETDPIALTAGNHTLTFTSDLMPGVSENTALIDAVSVSLSRPAVTVAQPVTQTAGVSFSVTGTVSDASGNPVQGTFVFLTLHGPGGLTSGTTAGTTDSSGTFTFAGLTIDTAGSGYSITVSAPSVANYTFRSTDVFSVVPAAPRGITVSTIPNQIAGVPFSVTGEVTDAHGNGVPNVATTLTANGPGPFSSGTTSATTDGTGRFTFSGLSLSEPGSYALTVSAPSYGLTKIGNGFTVTQAAPTIHGFTPGSGPTGTTVTITGTNLSGATSVTFNGKAAAFTYVASTQQITATVPAGATTGTIRVTTPGGTATSAASYVVTLPAPTITGFSPASGAVGATVTITGTNLTGTSVVGFNGHHPTSFTVNGAGTQITTTVPEGATTGKIAVIAPGGEAFSAANFTVTLAVPTIHGFTPGSGPTGTTVTITGTSLAGTTSVTFNGKAAAFTYVASTQQITATVPTGATTGTIRVTTPGGTATSAASYVVTLPAPTIMGFSPASGAVGATVTITGTHLTGTSVVGFNGHHPMSFTINGAGTQITTTVPAGATTGFIAVIAPGGEARSATNFTVIAAPTIMSFSPASGSAGTKVTITGTNLTGTSVVGFNGHHPTSFMVNANGTQITTTVPAGATTGKIAVIAPGGEAFSAANFTVTP